MHTNYAKGVLLQPVFDAGIRLGKIRKVEIEDATMRSFIEAN